MPYSSQDEQAALRRGFNATQLSRIQMAKGLTNRDLAEVSDSQMRKLLRGLEQEDRPHARLAFLRMQQEDETGSVSPTALLRALDHLEGLREQAAPRPLVAGIPSGRFVAPRMLAPPPLEPGAGISSPAQWQAIGPGNIGGRTRSIIVHPDDPDTIWIGSAGGGVWRTDDGGQDWSPVNDKMANLAVSCMAMDPTNADTLYAGTGEGFDNIGAIRGAGIFRTTDGTNWAQLLATATPDFFWVNRLALSPDGAVLLAATWTGIFRSTDAARARWQQVLPAVPIADVRFHPSNPDFAVAGAQDDVAFFSTDNGRTWSRAQSATPWSGRVELAYAAANPRIVYASVEMDAGEIWRSSDGGQTYQKRTSLVAPGIPANYLGNQGWYDNAIWAGDPADENLLIVGGIDLWKSTDGGNRLKKISDWRAGTSAHADHHAIVAHPAFGQQGNRIVFFGNDGGIYRADNIATAGDPDPTQGWTSLVNGYDVTQFYGGAGHAPTGTIVGGAQDNGTLSFRPADGANRWREFFGGDGGFVASDPGNANIFYGEYVHLEIFRNDNAATGDNNWWEQYITGRFWNDNKLPQPGWDWKPDPFRIPEVARGQPLFIAPFVLDPNNANCLLGGGLALWRTNDAKRPNTNTSGPSWAAIKPGNIGAPISAIAVAQGDSDLIWVGYRNGQIHRTTDGTNANPVWQRIDSTGPDSISTGRFCTRIVIDPADHATIYVAFAGFAQTNLWKTTNSGAAWTVLSNALPEAPIRALAIHPRRRDYLYIGTEVGLFTSENGGATWSPTNEGPTNCAVYDLFWINETLVSVTHGRGMFTIDLSTV